MIEYIKQILKEIPDDLKNGTATNPAANHLFNVNDKAEKLNASTAVSFHHLFAQLLYAAKRTHKDILTCISFLTTRVRRPDMDDWKKLGRCLRFLKNTCDNTTSV